MFVYCLNEQFSFSVSEREFSRLRNSRISDFAFLQQIWLQAKKNAVMLLKEMQFIIRNY